MLTAIHNPSRAVRVGVVWLDVSRTHSSGNKVCAMIGMKGNYIYKMESGEQ